ncbi:hypothetical protein FACS189429_4270 [Bacteroidia bacterium]|nr:hypothetical protein FACS189429_4270 [Bacteroidia bacterium]GHV43318.1 hypothetical protein FACS1894180_2050 [Bacteroidia bacterium]
MLAGLVLLCGIGFIVLSNSAVQMKIVHYVEKELSDKLGTEVRVGGAYYKFFNNISLADVYVEALDNDTLTYIGEAKMRFSFFKLLQKKFVVRTLELNQLYANLKVDSAGTNFDFIVKAFEKPKTDTKNSNFVVNINKIEIKNSAFNFTNLKSKDVKLPENNHVFNANRLKFSDINTTIAFNLWKNDSISAEIKSFSLKEHSGLIINNLQTKGCLGGKNIVIDYLKVKLPNSNINFGTATLNYDSIIDFQQFNKNVQIKIPLENSAIAWNDLSVFVPDLQNIKGNFAISGNIFGTIENLALQNLVVRYGDHTSFAANIEANGLPDIAETFIYSDIQQFSSSVGDIQDLLANLTRQPVSLPPKLGKIVYKGNISGFLSNLVVYGTLQTGAGNAQTDILLKFSNHLQNLAYSGRIQSKSLKIGELIDNQQIGNIAFDISTTGTKLPKSGLAGQIKGKITEFSYNNYTYKDLQLVGNYDNRGFEGKAAIEDDNIKANFTGKIDMTNRKKPIFDFLLSVRNANLQNLNLYTKYPNSALTFNASTNMSGSSLDNMNGFVQLDSIEFKNNDKTLHISKINITTTTRDSKKNIALTSDFANGKLEGDFSYSTVNQTINNILQQYLPALAALPNKKQKPTYNQLKVDLTFSNLNKICDAFNLPFSFEGSGNLSGMINENTNLVDFCIEIPIVYLAKQRIENLNFTIHNQESNNLQLSAQAAMYNSKEQTVSFLLNANASNDLIRTDLSWINLKRLRNADNLSFDIQLAKENGSLTARADIKPAQIVIADSLWNIGAGSLAWTENKKLVIHKFRVENAEQFLAIDGIASKSADDKINIELSQLNLNSILKMVGLKGIEFGGTPTGEIAVSSVFSKPIFVADLLVANATMNNMPIGDAQVFSTYDEPTNSIVIDGVFLRENTDTVVIASGNYFIKNDSLNLFFDARGLGISFLNQYFQDVVKNVDGQGFGKVRLFGKTQDLSFDGNIFVKNGTANITLLNTTYTFNDTVYLRPESLFVNHIRLFDREKNQAIANGEMKHGGMFEHPVFDFTIQAKNLLALDTQSGDNEYFFGRVYADGTVQIKGNERVADFNINAVSKPRSKLFIRMQNTFTATNNSFIRFVNKNEKPDSQYVENQKYSDIQMLTRVNMQVEVTPDAEVELIVDPKSGDLINARGAGNLRLEFDSRSEDMKLFGTYTISNGYYLFSLQNLIRKEFKIDDGSAITWSGDMRNANVNIRGIYSLSASLRDLLDESDRAKSRANLPVNCVLQLTDNLMTPTIKLDLELPQSDASVQQYVKNVVNTEEMMNREIVSLLLIGRFYKPEYLNTATNQTNTGNEALSFAAATFNGLISRLLQSSEFTVGFVTNYSEQSQEYKAAINYQPNDRLVINGDVGYQNDALSNEGNQIIGDIDIEYKLIQNGKFRFKAYNHTVDRLGIPKQSQGVGFVYREEFSSVGEMMNYYLKKLIAPLAASKKKKE